jgi:precorrin-2 dehydrogenase/sirohydrochlorin ferrochelatase
MKNNHRFPIFLDLRKVPCLVVGGGPVATRKVMALRTAGADVLLVSPKITAHLQSLVKRGAIEWINKPYSPIYLKRMRLVIAATNNTTVNHKIYTDAERRGLFANVVDDLDYCRFVAPARYSGGSLEIAVTTGGAAPAIAKIIRDDIDNFIGKRYAPIVTFLGKRRAKIKRLSPKSKKAFWERVASLVKTSKSSDDILRKKLDGALAVAEGGGR